ncbi:hypothetical protein DKP78_02135 [Enterococcus faecium]|nr:hypothetical protein DKP78_02135 [Enterococcus faecium]
MEHRLYQEVVRLPFSSESQGVISKNIFSCLMTIVTCDRGVGRKATFILKKELRTLAVLFLKYGIKEVSSRQEKKAKEIAI